MSPPPPILHLTPEVEVRRPNFSSVSSLGSVGKNGRLYFAFNFKEAPDP